MSMPGFMRNIAEVLEECNKPPLNAINGFLDKVATGEIFGTKLKIRYPNGEIKDGYAFDLQNPCYVINNEEFIRRSNELAEELSYHGMFDSNCGYEC